MLETFSGRNASQNEFELRQFVKLLQDAKVKKYLEIGARHGDTFHEVMINLPKGSHGVAVDLPGALWGKKSSIDSLHRAAEDLRKRGYTIEVIVGDSTAPNIVNKIKAIGGFEAVLIDGDHTYQGVKKDWDNYHTLAPLVALHDIVGDGQMEKVYKNKVEVPRFWKELTARYSNTFQFVDKGSLMGIGVCNLA